MSSYSLLQLVSPLPVTGFTANPYPTVLTFDTYSDLLHIGSSTGTVTCLSSPLGLDRYVYYPAHGALGFGPFSSSHLGAPAGVQAIRVTEKEVRTLTEGGLSARRRNGVGKWKIDDPTHGLRTFATNPTNSHEVIAGGAGGQLMLINTSRGEVVRSLDQSHSLIQLESTRSSLITASPTGHMQLMDPRQGFRATNSVSSASTYSGGLTGIDLVDNTILTWGWSSVQGQPTPEPIMKLFDVRTLRSSYSMNFPPGPAFARLHPTISNTALVVSAQGWMEMVDSWGGESGQGIQLECSSYITAMSISSQGDYAAFGDMDGQVHLYTSQDISETSQNIDEDGMLKLPPFNGFEGIKVEWPDMPMPLPVIDWDETTPLNVIGLPYYDEPLLSNISPSAYATLSSPLLQPQPPIPKSVLSSVRIVDGVGYAPLPKELRGTRNVVCKSASNNLLFKMGSTTNSGKELKRNGGRRESGPRFRSEKKLTDVEMLLEEALTLGGDGKSQTMPKYYRRVEIKYSRFGVEDFDFEYYNHTTYSGLETHISNSYTNAVLQALHYLTPIRTCAKAHITRDCRKEHCMLCESGFLFRMLEDAKGINCQASNFSRAFSSISQAHSLGLFVTDEDDGRVDLASIIQKFNRWLITTYSDEDFDSGKQRSQRLPSPRSPVSNVTSMTCQNFNSCGSCGMSTTRDVIVHAIDMLYSRKTLANETIAPTDFASLLQASLMRDSTSKATCSFCKRVVQLRSRRVFPVGLSAREILPPVLAVNSAILTDDHKELWRDKASKPAEQRRFLPDRVRVRMQEDGVFSVVARSASEDAEAGPGEVIYKIKSLVAQVVPEEGASHLVSLVEMPGQDDVAATWVLFNDFLVREVSKEEALGFAAEWKVPAVVYLERVDATTPPGSTSPDLPQQLDTSILFKDDSISTRRARDRIRHQLLTPDEAPTAGTLISIDAEFVALQMEELEIRSGGTKQVLRPSKMSLARVSVLRGQGPQEGEPFIDDYIHTSEKVMDYLTEFSGIKEGDLDPYQSIYTVVPLKAAYKKLRLLVDLGCIFVGHGLSKDFRTINIFVPPSQVIDTVNIYYDPARHRKLSLRFLSWFLLKQDIQTAEHDSIEDARSALLLYRMYQTFVNENRFEDVMEDIFEAGKRLGFKPPIPAAAMSPGNLDDSVLKTPPMQQQSSSGLMPPASTFPSQRSPSRNQRVPRTLKQWR